MATRKRTVKIEVPIPPISNGASTIQMGTDKLESTSLNGSPFLPTPREFILLAIYPFTLVLGSIFSSLDPANRKAICVPDFQAYAVDQAPSYFAKKSNIFNVYFVKIGWVWITTAFFLLILSHSSLGPPLRPQITRRRIQASLRYVCITAIWIFVTQWFFGPAIIDRSFRWTGGKCEAIAAEIERCCSNG